MKYNLGCGSDYRFGWINCDKYPDSEPDLVMDLESFPWPIADDSAEEVLLSHVLEHLGGHSNVFLDVMRELYRICRPSARIVIRVPDPRHDDYFSDPTHQRPILPGTFQPLDLALNEEWQSRKLPGTPLAKYLKIDLPVVSVTRHLDPQWLNAWQSKSVTDDALTQAVRSSNNVVQWSEIVLEARKPFSPGQSLKKVDALVVKRVAGMGDVLMALSALSAVRAATGLCVYIETSPDYEGIASACPAIERVFTDADAMVAHFRASGMADVRYLDWSPAHFGISRLHQVDAFLMSLGLTLPEACKGVRIELAAAVDVDRHLAGIPAGRRKVVLHPGVTDPNRTWPPQFWQALAEDLVAAGDAVIVVGETRSQDGRSVASLDRPSVLDLTDRLTLDETLALLRRCDILISGDSGPIQLAGASDIAIVGLYSVVAGSNRLPHRPGDHARRAVAVAPSCRFHPCYPRMNDPEAVARFCAEDGVSPTDVPALFARWCVNPERYACVREPETLGRVKAALAPLA
ncbi:hypothetical protein D3273_18270 [Lichenibacterium minor]|uniref:Glycosyltransferase family 9 protein n=1 Tax=Lichenibacterium minor TaxID=2316528 RepID=A0A4Q2U1Y4_9HYPH|nr:glycosyltransferase family 9 protein [Lichenibacterium minor]RYC30483.1 hypothetical protein D3273_18270 [Lichenibacterium minor]